MLVESICRHSLSQFNAASVGEFTQPNFGAQYMQKRFPFRSLNLQTTQRAVVLPNEKLVGVILNSMGIEWVMGQKRCRGDTYLKTIIINVVFDVLFNQFRY